MHEFAHILCPVDFSDASLHAVTYSARLAERLQLPLTILHVIAPLPVYPSTPEGLIALPPPAPVDEQVRESHARDRLASLERQLSGFVRSTAEVLHGDPGRTIVQRTTTTPDALLVMGTHGYSGFQRFILGSTTAEVLRRAACPVLTVREQHPDTPPKRIGVAVDFSACCEPAIEAAARLAKTFGAELHLIHVRPPIEVPTSAETHIPLYLDKIGEASHLSAQRELEEIASRLEGITVIRSVLVGANPFRDLVSYAHDAHLDLLAMGTHGRTGLRRLFLGSTAERTVQVAPCPVLTMRLPSDIPAELSWREIADDLRLTPGEGSARS